MCGVRLGAVRESGRLRLSVVAPEGWGGRVPFDRARHRRVINLDRDYVRLNEFPEWFTVDENTLYQLTSDSGDSLVRLGSELIEGLRLEPGNWTVESLGPPPYGPVEMRGGR